MKDFPSWSKCQHESFSAHLHGRRSSKACKNKNGGAKTFGFTSPQQRKSSLEPPKFQRSLEPSLVRATSSVSLTSSDSGLSMASSLSSSPPSFEEARSAVASAATKLELPDPLLGGGGGGGFSGGGDSRDGAFSDVVNLMSVNVK